MIKSIFRQVFVLSLVLATGALLPAQSEAEMTRVFEWKFSLAAPDSSFQPMEGENGWEEPATTAKVICMATPVPFAKMEQDLSALNTEDGQKVIEKKPMVINGVSGLLILLEFTPVAGEDTDVVYSLMFARPFDGASLVINAQYPKSQHERLFDKFLTAFGTVRKIEN